MTISAISSAGAGAYSASAQALPPLGQHKQPIRSLSDVDAQGSSVAGRPSATGKLGSRVDMSA